MRAGRRLLDSGWFLAAGSAQEHAECLVSSPAVRVYRRCGVSLLVVAQGLCVFCGRDDVSTVMPPAPTPASTDSIGICESCSRVADWTWRSQFDASLVTTSPFPVKPGVALVMIVRPRVVTVDDETIVDPACPWDVLMVTRKDEPGTYALPGGKLKPGETSDVAGPRELVEETGVLTWRSALETLYTGFSARGRLVEVFLCRGWAGEPKMLEVGVEPAWKPWPPGQHVGSQAGFYPGVEHAFAVRSRLQVETQATQELCLRLGHTAALFVESCLGEGQPTDEQVQLQKGYHYVMTSEERQTADFILRDARGQRALALAVSKSDRRGPPRGPKHEAGDEDAGSGVVQDGDVDGDGVEDAFKRE